MHGGLKCAIAIAQQVRALGFAAAAQKDQVELAIGVQIHSRGYAAVGDGQSGSLMEPASSIAEHDVGLMGAARRDVQLAIAIEVTDDEADEAEARALQRKRARCRERT